MKYQYKLDKLGCANCAGKMENEISKLDGVKNTSINFMSSVLTFETENFEEVLPKISKVVEKIEPDVTLCKLTEHPTEEKQGQQENEHEHEESWKQRIIRIAIGAMLFAAAYLTEIFYKTEVLTLILFASAYFVSGADVLYKAVRNIMHGKVFNENFLMGLATIGAFAIGEYSEGVAVMLFYQIGEFFLDIAVNSSRKSISKLMNIRPDYANLLKNGKEEKVSPDKVEVGDEILIKAGERLPLDGNVISGSSNLDVSALTGESMPKSVSVGDSVLSGSINLDGILKIKVSAEFSDSTVAKILKLTETAGEKKAKTESIITKFSKIYTPVVVILAAMIAFIPYLIVGGTLSEWVYRGLVFLVISCPCALVLSVPVGYFGGIGAASKCGILIKGGNILEALTNVEAVVFDKTGTLTHGNFSVSGIYPAKDFSEDEVLKFASIAESFSSHPIAKSIIAKSGEGNYKKPDSYREISGKGILSTFDEDEISVGNSSHMNDLDIAFDKCDEAGTVVYVAKNRQYVGCIVISDEIKVTSAEAILLLKKNGVSNTVMLTGDSDAVGQSVSKKVGIDKAYTELLPDKKAIKLEEIKNKCKKGSIAFVGDGINDAPSLAVADIGIAMGGVGSDAAIEASDVVIMTDDLLKLPQSIKISRYTKKIVMQNIIFALSIKLIILIFGALGFAGMWLAVFADVGVAVLAVLNSLRIIAKNFNKI